MFKNIQKQLLIKFPLLWNTRVVPMTAILIVLNLVFFFIGWIEGKLNFSENGNNYYSNNDGLVIFFSVFISLLLIIIWLAFYFKNNSFKSFYLKNNFSLFKEWCILLFISFLISLFTVSFYFGKETRVRSYFSEIEAIKRCEILSKASFFVEGSFSNNYTNDVVSPATIPVEVVQVDSTNMNAGFIHFNGKKYSTLSLLNKNLNSYTFFNYESDSIHKKTIKTWLVKQQKDSIKKLFKDYLNIAKEHHLKANINENEWLNLIYNYPDFEKFKLIGSDQKGEYYYADNYRNGNVFDRENKYVATIGNQQYEYYKYYVPESKLHFNYNKISDSWMNPDVNFETLLIAIYFAFGISLLIFSFRVTSGKSWLISVVCLGVLGILFGIISIIISWDYTFPILMILTILFSIIYFIITLYKSKSKNISSLMVNIMLWSILGLFPLFYFITIEILKDISYDNYLDYSRSKYYPAIQFMKENSINFLYFNLLFVILKMVLLSSKIKQWRGLAEN